MRILFISQYFPPEMGAPAARTYELARRWVQRGAEVTVVTAVPNHPTGVVPEAYRNGSLFEENIDGIRYLNQEGECDVVFRLAANHGISRDHASSLNFSFGDNARIKAYGAADFAYVEGYIRSLQERTRGAPPKL